MDVKEFTGSANGVALSDFHDSFRHWLNTQEPRNRKDDDWKNAQYSDRLRGVARTFWVTRKLSDLAHDVAVDFMEKKFLGTNSEGAEDLAYRDVEKCRQKEGQDIADYWLGPEGDGDGGMEGKLQKVIRVCTNSGTEIDYRKLNRAVDRNVNSRWATHLQLPRLDDDGSPSAARSNFMSRLEFLTASASRARAARTSGGILNSLSSTPGTTPALANESLAKSVRDLKDGLAALRGEITRNDIGRDAPTSTPAEGLTRVSLQTQLDDLRSDLMALTGEVKHKVITRPHPDRTSRIDRRSAKRERSPLREPGPPIKRERTSSPPRSASWLPS